MDPLNTLSRRSLFGLAPALALVAAGCDQSPYAPRAGFRGVDITGAEYARRLSLPDVDGKVRDLADFRGKLSLVFFGYTQCPDVCPTTMLELAEAKKALGADGALVQGVFITIDPERDTAEVLKAYVGNFGPDFIGLRGSAQQIAEAAKEFKIFYAKVPGKLPGSYTMDHTAGAYIFDRTPRVRLFTRYGAGAQALTEDLRRLISEKPAEKADVKA
jgi:protein SCO1/2